MYSLEKKRRVFNKLRHKHPDLARTIIGAFEQRVEHKLK